jgi:microcystin degradation protein MlrC
LVVLGHGAGRTTDDLDPDGTYLDALRAVVGAEVPVVVVLDFHANLSERMCSAADVLIAYRTNPHIDIAERLVEAASTVLRLIAGGRVVSAWCRLPMVLPQIAQLTTEGEPMGELRVRAEQLATGSVWSVSVLGGFSLGDSPDAGMAVYAVAETGADAARVVDELAMLAWNLRDRYRIHATPLADSVLIAADASAGRRAPVILADLADNPGGGAPGNTTFVLEALTRAGVDDVVMGLQCDRAVVEQAWAAGVGAELDVEFNRGSTRPFATPLRAQVTVLQLTDAVLVPTRGVYAGSQRHPGRSCSLLVHGVGERGIRVGVSSHAVQCADDDTLRHVGLEPSAASVVVVKSRGHFRAGFDHLFEAHQIVEVSAPGVATSDLQAVQWTHLPRPVFPLDRIDNFVPSVIVKDGGR